MKTQTYLIKTKMSDHEFAKYLNKQGDWDYEQTTPNAIRFFRKKDKKFLALAIYDNSKCTRNIYLPKEI